MKTKDKNLILIIIVWLVSTIIPSFLFDKWIEGIFFFICHWFIREQFPKQYHHIVPSVCRAITGNVLFFGISFMLPRALSLLSAVPINYLIGWVGYTKKQADEYEYKYEKLKEKFCNDKAELLLKCKKAKLNKRDTEIAIKYYYEKQTPKEIWLWLCENKEYESIEWDSIYHLLWKIKSKINKK